MSSPSELTDFMAIQDLLSEEERAVRDTAREFAARQNAAEGMLAISDYPLHAAILRGRGQARRPLSRPSPLARRTGYFAARGSFSGRS